jgi:mannose-6-phosphate isomerase-like protein (cupin superfamily)
MTRQAVAPYEQKDMKSPDERRTFEKGRIDLVNVRGRTIGRATLEPGWKWSPHFQYHVSGRLHVLMQDGSEFEVGPGEVTYLPPGHDAWVVGDEPAVVVDWQGMSEYAEQ